MTSALAFCGLCVIKCFAVSCTGSLVQIRFCSHYSGQSIILDVKCLLINLNYTFLGAWAGVWPGADLGRADSTCCRWDLSFVPSVPGLYQVQNSLCQGSLEVLGSSSLQRFRRDPGWNLCYIPGTEQQMRHPRTPVGTRGLY